jgi:hypothetical protein
MESVEHSQDSLTFTAGGRQINFIGAASSMFVEKASCWEFSVVMPFPDPLGW